MHEIGVKKWPLLTREQQFADAFTDPANAASKAAGDNDFPTPAVKEFP